MAWSNRQNRKQVKAKTTLTEQELSILGYVYRRGLSSARAEKSHNRRWINEYQASIVFNVRQLERLTAQPATDDVTAVRISNYKESIERSHNSITRCEATIAKLDAHIAWLVQAGTKELAEREETIAKEQAAAKEVAR